MAAGIKVKNIEKMRAQYAAGDSIRSLAVQFGCCRATVTRYCQDIEQPAAPPPLSAKQIGELLRHWSRPLPIVNYGGRNQ